MIEVKKKEDVSYKMPFAAAPEGEVLRWEGRSLDSNEKYDDYYIKLGGNLYSLGVAFMSISPRSAEGFYSVVKNATVVITLEV